MPRRRAYIVEISRLVKAKTLYILVAAGAHRDDAARDVVKHDANVAITVPMRQNFDTLKPSFLSDTIARSAKTSTNTCTASLKG